jgi:WG containing repeat
MIKYLAILLVATAALAQEYNGPYVPYRKANAWGYADTLGKIIVTPAYDRVSDNGISSHTTGMQYKVYKAGKSGVIDSKGNIVVPVEFDSVYPRGFGYKDHGFLVEREGLWGMYTMNGKLSIPVQYQDLHKTYFERDNTPQGKTYFAKKGNEYLVIDDQDNMLVGGLDGVSELCRDGVRLKKGGKYALFNIRERKAVTPFEYDSLAVIAIDPYTDYDVSDIFYGAANGKMYLLDVDGNRREVSKMPEIGNDSGSIPFMSVDPDIIIEEKVINADNVDNSLYSTDINEKDGHKYIFSNLKCYPDGSMFIRHPKKNLIGILGVRRDVEADGITPFLPPLYNKIGLFDNLPVVVVYQGDKAGLHSLETNRLQLEPGYDAIKYQGQFVLVSKGKTGIFDDNHNGLVKGEPNTVYIAPAYDGYLKRVDLSAFGRCRDFRAYVFLQKGKTCYVGHNGVKFFED